MPPPPSERDERGAPNRRRRLRAAFAADVAAFSRMVSLDETGTLDRLSVVREIARAELLRFDGWLFGMPGDGVFALFESAVDAVACGLSMQARIAAAPEAGAMRMRVGVHLGDVLFEDEMPFGETLAIAARLEALAEPGGLLVSQSVRDAVAQRMRAGFEPRGAPPLKNIDRRIALFAVTPEAPPRPAEADLGVASGASALDRTTLVPIAKAAEAQGARPATAQEIAMLTRLMAQHIGPIAPMVVARAVRPDVSCRQAVRVLADAIPDAAGRDAFLAEARRAFGDPL